MTAKRDNNSSFWLSFYPWLGLFGGVFFAFCQWMIYEYAPTEATLGISQKLFYYHLPMAWWGLFSFFVVFIASILYLKTKNLKWDSLASAAASLGLLLAVLALLTGMFWGRMAWGIWWTWDARLTTTLVMCFIYAGYMIFRNLDMSPARRAGISSVIGIIAFLDVPLVFFSARLWSYIHPPSIELDPKMKTTLIVSILAFGFLWVSLVSLRYYLAEGADRIQSLVTQKILKNN